MSEHVLAKGTDLSGFEGARVRLVRRADTTSQKWDAIFTGRLHSPFHCDALKGVVGTLDLEPAGERPGGRTSIHLPYGSAVEIIEEAGDE